MNENLLHLTDVSKSFGEVNAIEHVSLDIKDRSVIGLVGGNGAGKTTLLRMMAGIYKPTTGRVYLKDGENVDQMRSLLGVVPESTGLYSKLTAWENIRFHSRIHGIEDSVAWSRTSDSQNYWICRIVSIDIQKDFLAE